MTHVPRAWLFGALFGAVLVLCAACARATRQVGSSIEVVDTLVATLDDPGVVLSLAPPQLTRQYTLTLHSFGGVVFAAPDARTPATDPLETNATLESLDDGAAERVRVSAAWPWGVATSTVCEAHTGVDVLRCVITAESINATARMHDVLLASFTSAHQDVMGMHCGVLGNTNTSTMAPANASANATHDAAADGPQYVCLVHMERESVDIALSARCVSDVPMQASMGLDATYWVIGPAESKQTGTANITRVVVACDFTLVSPTPDERARRVMIVSICTLVSLVLGTSTWLVQRWVCGTNLVSSRGKYMRLS